jgi:hypothetical protein
MEFTLIVSVYLLIQHSLTVPLISYNAHNSILKSVFFVAEILHPK